MISVLTAALQAVRYTAVRSDVWCVWLCVAVGCLVRHTEHFLYYNLSGSALAVHSIQSWRSVLHLKHH